MTAKSVMACLNNVCVYIHHDFHSYVHVAKIILFLYPSNRSNKTETIIVPSEPGEEHNGINLATGS